MKADLLVAFSGKEYGSGLGPAPSLPRRHVRPDLRFQLHALRATTGALPVPWAIKSYMVVYIPLGLYGVFGINLLPPAVSVSLASMLFTLGLALKNLRTVMS